jgi:O-antigen/teichoic acid export membrane protein
MTLPDLQQSILTLWNWRPGKLAKGTLVMTLGIGLRTAGQAVVFIVVARLLGIEAYGAYAAVLAIAGSIGCFGGCGIQTVMLRDVSRDPTAFPLAWGNTLIVMGLSFPVLMGFYLLCAKLFLPDEISRNVVICIGIAELLFSPLSQAGINAYQAHEHLGKSAWLTLTPILSRLTGTLTLLAIVRLAPSAPPLELWAELYATTAILAAMYTVRLVNRDLGRPQWPKITKTFTNLHEGLIFAFSGTALKLYTDIDKTMLARLAGLEAAGLYSAAYRVMDMASIPIIALLTTSLPRFFRASRGHAQGQSIILWHLLPAPICYATGIGLVVFFTAAWLPNILGASFLPAVSAVQWLAWLPLLSLPRLFLQTKLITSDLQRAVVAVLSVGSVFNIFLNFLLILPMNWRGAIIATYAAEVAMGLTLFKLYKKIKPPVTPLQT